MGGGGGGGGAYNELKLKEWAQSVPFGFPKVFLSWQDRLIPKNTFSLYPGDFTPPPNSGKSM